MPSLPIHSYRIDSAVSGRLVNCYAEAAPTEAPEGGKSPLILHRSPGITPLIANGTGPGRGLHAMRGRLYGVSGGTLFNALLGTSLGGIAGAGRTYMSDNGTQLAIVGDSSGYVYASGALVAITDTDFVPGPSVYIDNYLVSIRPGTGQFDCSDLSDFTNYDGLDFATAEAMPDDLISIAADHRQAILIGEESTEIWENVGGSGFPFERIANGVIEIGGSGPRAVIKQDQSVFWLANDLTLRRLTGNTPVRVSQHGAERKWREYTTVSDCEMDAYTIDGHLCVVLSFPSANATWVYDCTTQELSEREGERYQKWDVSGIAKIGKTTYVQRASTGEIGILDPACYSQWGGIMRAEWTYQNIYGQGQPLFHSRLELGIQTGVGNDSEADPHLSLDFSNDGGRTFPISMPTRAIGQQGQFRERVHWDQLGSSYDRVYRNALAEAVPLTLWDAQFSAD